jgi:RNase H-fold protein (predicted Holliday junction resolvase)
MQVLAVDPGREKCGVVLALIRDPGLGAAPVLEGAGGVEVLVRDIWPRGEFFERLSALLAAHTVDVCLLGDATSSGEMKARLERDFPQVSVAVVDERNSTLEARALYWRAHPPRGIMRLVPLSLQVPPCPVDDFAAEVLVRRFANAQRD